MLVKSFADSVLDRLTGMLLHNCGSVVKQGAVEPSAGEKKKKETRRCHNYAKETGDEDRDSIGEINSTCLNEMSGFMSVYFVW